MKLNFDLLARNSKMERSCQIYTIPPLLKHRRIIAYLDAPQAKVDALGRLQAETGAELDALLSSILDKAFKGELL